jgi:hypothetical protein
VSAGETAELAQKRAQIERTRAEMSGTIDAIQEKLSPQHIAEQVKTTVNEQLESAKASVRDATIGKAEALMRDAGDTMNDVRYSTMDTVRSNPIPAAMVALGLGWLFMNRSSGRRERERLEQYRRSGGYGPRYQGDQYRGEMYYQSGHPAFRGDAMTMASRGVYDQQRHDEGMMAQAQRRAGDVAGQAQSAVGGAVSSAQSAVGGAVSTAQDAVGSAVSTAQDAVGTAAQRAQETAGALAERTTYTYHRAEDQFQRLLWENPLAIGAAALAVGAIAGLALPQTERENQLMGEARDNLVEQAKSVAAETLDKVQQVAGDVTQGATQQATEKAREVGLTGTNTK